MRIIEEKDDFEWLVAGKKDLAEMQVLENAGLFLVRLERFQNALISLVMDTAFDTFAWMEYCKISEATRRETFFQIHKPANERQRRQNDRKKQHKQQ